jgi:hypothetical protein
MSDLWRRIRGHVLALKDHTLATGGCKRCRTPWTRTGYHVTEFNGSFGLPDGVFPLCDWCWEHLTPDKRWPYYAELIHEWRLLAINTRDVKRVEKDARSVRAAVKRGL